MIKYIWLNVSFKANVSPLIFCLDDLSIDVSGGIKLSTIIILLSISPFRSTIIFFTYLGTPMLVA